MMEFDWFWKLCIAMAVVFTVLPAILYSGGEKDTALKVFAGFWGAVVMLVIFTLTMTFIIKPLLAWFFGLF